MTDAILDLIRQWPDASVRVTNFDSGSIDIEARVADEVIVVQWDGQAVGISRLSEQDEIFSGFDNTFDNVEDATAYLTSLLRQVSSSRES